MAFFAHAQQVKQGEAELKEELLSWLETEENSQLRNTNMVVWERAYGDFLQKRYDCLKSNANGNADRGWTLKDSIVAATGGPPEFIEFIADRYWFAMACRYNSCEEAGLIIADKEQRAIHFSILHRLPWYEFDEEQLHLGEGNLVSVFVDPITPTDEINPIADLALLFAQRQIKNAVSKTDPDDQALTIGIYGANCNP